MAEEHSEDASLNRLPWRKRRAGRRHLREALRALSAAYEITYDRDRSIFWFRNTPIPEFGDRTAEQIVAEGKTDAIVHLRSSDFQCQSSKIALDVIANPAADGLIEGRRIQ